MMKKLNNTDLLRQLRWKCRRGMLELDELLLNFLEHEFAHLPPAEQKNFINLLEHNDQQLWNWFIVGEEMVDTHLKNTVAQIRITFTKRRRA